MAAQVNQSYVGSSAYGFNNALQFLAPYPITKALANPSTSNKAQPATIWCNSSNQTTWILNSISNNLANWQQIMVSGAAGTFSSLTVNPGDLTVTAGNILASAGNITATAGDLSIGGTGTVTGPFQATNSVATPLIQGLTAGNLEVGTAIASAASPTATVAIAANVGTATFTGFTTAAAASQAFVVTNASITATSQILATVANLGTNAAYMTLVRVLPAAGQVTFEVTNNGAAALNGNVMITFWILEY